MIKLFVLNNIQLVGWSNYQDLKVVDKQVMSNYSTLLTENDCKLLKILKSRKKEIENIFFKYSEHYILGIRVDANGGCSR